MNRKKGTKTSVVNTSSPTRRERRKSSLLKRWKRKSNDDYGKENDYGTQDSSSHYNREEYRHPTNKDDDSTPPPTPTPVSTTTASPPPPPPMAILQHCVYLEHPYLPEDPTVEESIECVFAHQLEEGLPLMEEDEHYDEMHDVYKDKEEKDESQDEEDRVQQHYYSKQQQRRRLQRRSSGSLVHVSTFDPSKMTMEEEEDASSSCTTITGGGSSTTTSTTRSIQVKQETKKTNKKCSCRLPQHWPQAPLLLRPTPNSGTKIVQIRKANGEIFEPFDYGCPECPVLPINNGRELEGESLIIDFESNLFQGSLLLRIRNTQSPYNNNNNNNKEQPQQQQQGEGYFEGMNRRYQVVVEGQFKHPINLTQCTTGLHLSQPLGKMPPSWMVKGGIKVISFFAPQLSVDLECQHPYSVSPLLSTPQVLKISNTRQTGLELEHIQHEPNCMEHSILDKASTASTSLARAKWRKKHTDRLYQHQIPLFASKNKVYTFEFLQHMIDFTKFEIEMGSYLKSLEMAPILNGQPLQIMAQYNNKQEQEQEFLWCFDIWHQDLLQMTK